MKRSFPRGAPVVKLSSLLVTALVLVVAGCGGGGKKTTSQATTAAAATTPATTAASTAPAVSAFGNKNCAQLVAMGTAFAHALEQATSGKGTATFSSYSKALQAMVSAAPSAIRGALSTIAAAFDTYVQAYTKLGIKQGSTPSVSQFAQIANAAKSLSSPKLQAAEQQLAAWAGSNCAGG